MYNNIFQPFFSSLLPVCRWRRTRVQGWDWGWGTARYLPDAPSTSEWMNGWMKDLLKFRWFYKYHYQLLLVKVIWLLKPFRWAIYQLLCNKAPSSGQTIQHWYIQKTHVPKWAGRKRKRSLGSFGFELSFRFAKFCGVLQEWCGGHRCGDWRRLSLGLLRSGFICRSPGGFSCYTHSVWTQQWLFVLFAPFSVTFFQNFPSFGAWRVCVLHLRHTPDN